MTEDNLHWFKGSIALVDESRAFQGRYTLAVWLAYLHFANSTTRRAWPSKQTIANHAGCSIRAVQRSAAELLQRGHLVADGVEVVGKIALARYLVPDPTTPVQPDRGVSSQTPTPVQPDAPPLSGQSPKQEEQENKKTERHKTRARARAKTPAPPGDVSVAALPSDVERPAPSGRRPLESDQPPYDEQQTVRVLIEAGIHSTTRNPWKATTSLVRDYRLRWPASDPASWVQFAAFQQLTGPVKTRAAWIATHLTGYGRKGWLPRNRDGSPRLWHQALLQGRYDDARRFAGLEVSYAPERLAEQRKATLEPVSAKPRPSSSPRSLAEILQSTAII